MDQIFQDYYDKILTGDELLKEIYGTYRNVPLKWVQCENITIKALVNRICDDFESNGFDLDDLPIVNIREKFMDYEPVVRVPPEWEQLVEAKALCEKELKSIRNNEYLMKHETINEIISHFEGTIVSIDNKLKGLV